MISIFFLVVFCFVLFMRSVSLYCPGWSWIPGLKQSSRLGLLNSWDYRHAPLCSASLVISSEHTKHQLTLTCSWFRQPRLGVKWLGQMILLDARIFDPAARQKSLAWYATGQRTQRINRPKAGKSGTSKRKTKILNIKRMWVIQVYLLALKKCHK